MFLTLKDEQNESSNSGINIPDGAEYVQEIPISEISDFPDHPFKVRQDEAMLNMTESIRENGVRQPAIVRPMPDGGYQMLSGHRRKAACMAIGKLTIPAVVREMSDDEAVICMVEANHQRENILPSERAFSYKMQLEAMKRQAGRPAKNNSAQVGLDFRGKQSRDILAEQVGESKNQIQRYIRLTELVPLLLQMVDDKKIAFNPAVELSYIPHELQTELLDIIEANECTPSLSQAQRMKQAAQEGKLDRNGMELVMQEEKPQQNNISFTVVDGQIYYRENSRMNKMEVSVTAANRIKGMIELRDCTRRLIEYQLEGYPDEDIAREQRNLNTLYDRYTDKYGLLNSRANNMAFSDDSAYCLLCSLEVIDENGNLGRKADMFTKRTIRQQSVVTSVDTATEALAVSLSEKAKVDMPYMAELTGKTEEQLADELTGVIFLNPTTKQYETADEYLSGDVRWKLQLLREIDDPQYAANMDALEKVQPKDLSASEIDVRLGATWLPPKDIEQFVHELLSTAYYIRNRIRVHYSPITAAWNIENKNSDYNNVAAGITYGTNRINAYKIIEETLNLKDVRIFDTVTDENGNEVRVLNKKDTILAQQKQQLIKDAFRDWIWKDPERRETLVRQYNEEMNSTRPREYDGSHIVFSGMNPEITLREHQKNAIAHVLYGGNTLLAHEVGAGKSATRS